MSKQEFLECTKDFWAGVLSGVDDDLPDGAWFQVHVDLADSLMDECCKALGVKKPKDIDGYDITEYYLSTQNRGE